MATRANKMPLNTETLTAEELATWQMPVNHQPPSQLMVMNHDEDEEEDESATDRVAAMLGSVAEDDKAFVKVQKIIGPNKYAHCDKYSIADYERGGETMIREDWGPGEYDIRLYGVKPETGKFGVRAKVMLTISAKLGEPVAAVKQQNSELSEVLKTIAQGQQQMLTALTTRPEAPDPMVQLVQMANLMKALGVAGGAQQPTTLRDRLEEMKLMREMAGDFAGNPKEPEEPSLMGMLPGMLDLIKGAQAKQQDQQSQAMEQDFPPVSLPAPSPTQAPEQSTQQPHEGTEAMDLAAMSLMGNLTRMCIMAQTGADPQKGADILYEKLPDEFIDLMMADEWFAMLSGYAPQVKPFQGWFTQARDLAVKMFQDDFAAELPTQIIPPEVQS